MKIVLTGSISNVGHPLTCELVEKGHDVTVITSKKERIADIGSLGAKAAVGNMFDADFLSKTFEGADIVYLMETMDAAGDMFDKSVDFIGSITKIGENYKLAVLRSGVKQVVHLSSIGAHKRSGYGILEFHHNVELILRELPNDIAIKFIRPVGFFTNLYSFIRDIRTNGNIVSNYGGDQKEPWVHPVDIAAVISEEMEKPFSGRTVRYVASDEVSPNEIAKALGKAIGKNDLQWKVISDEDLLDGWLKIGFNSQMAHGFVEMQASQGTGTLYEDYYLHKPGLGKIKLDDFAKQFAEVYNAD
jgi:uncharacterized protein YbjT (DUF2867 family)